jgi:hypothetical protein
VSTSPQPRAEPRLAYIISAYKLPEQAVRLVERLNTGTSTACFLVHVDKKADAGVYRRLVGALGPLPNVRFLKRHTCYWGGFGHVAATLEGIHALHQAGLAFEYAILLTGQDYPIKSNQHIRRFLQKHLGTNFLEHFPLPRAAWDDGGLPRIQSWHLRILHRHVKLSPPGWLPWRRRIPGGVIAFGGSSYWCITRDCVEYIKAYLERKPEFISFFKHVDVPDELFFQTIVMNSRFRDTVVNDDLRYTVWDDLTSGSPAVLTRDDFSRLASSAKLFARKFDATVDAEVLELIDRELLA